MARANRNQQQNNNGSAVNDPEVLSYAEMVESEFLRLYYEKDIANVPERRKPKAIDSLWNEIYTLVFKPDKPQTNNCMSKLQPYQVEQLQAVVNTYIDLCNLYGGVIKFGQFCKLVGYSRYTIDYWHKLNKDNKDIFIINSDDIYKEIETNVYIINNINDIDNNNIIHVKDNIYIDNIKVLNDNNCKEVDLLSRRRLDIRKKLQQEMQDENTNALSVDTMGAAIRANNEEELGKLYEPKRMIQAEQIKQIATAGQLPRFEISSGNAQTLIDKGL